MTSSKTKGEIWRGRIFKMIIFFAVMGMVVLSLGVTMLSKVFSDILTPDPPPVSTPAKH